MKHSDSVIIVPYRNRSAHMAQFISHMTIHYPDQKICIVEQYDYKNFNRAKLLNVGFLENSGYSRYIMHDIDMLPINVDYNAPAIYSIVQMLKSNIQQVDYLGGVTRFNQHIFEALGGYNNDYFHRAEDNEMMFNIKRLNLFVSNKYQEFKELQHERKGPEFIQDLWEKAQQPRIAQDQLSICNYVVISKEKINENITSMIVAI